jgi:hypothetical protein
VVSFPQVYLPKPGMHLFSPRTCYMLSLSNSSWFPSIHMLPICIQKLSSYLHSVYQNDWSGLKVDYIHQCGELNYKYRVILSLEAPNYWRNALKCAWMWKETIFNIYYEHALFCIVPGMCI